MSTGGESSRKRQRVTQACNQCRQRKYRCDGAHPICSPCKNSARICTYGSVSKRRGLQSGYIRAVECLWGLVFEKIEGSEDVVHKLVNSLPLAKNDSPMDQDARSDQLSELWRKSGVPQAIESLLDRSQPSGRSSERRLSESMKEQQHDITSSQMWSLTEDESIPSLPTDPEELPELPELSIQLESLEPSRQPEPSQPARAPDSEAPEPLGLSEIPESLDFPEPPEPHLDSLQQKTVQAQCSLQIENEKKLPALPSDWYSLAQAYIVNEHSWYPILERQTLFRIAYSYQQKPDSDIPVDEQNTGDYAVLWAVLWLGELHINGAKSSRIASFRFACGMFLSPENLTGQHQNYAQAFLILALINLGLNRVTMARMALAQALVIATAQLPQGISEDLTLKRRRDLVICSCFVLDNIIACQLYIKPQMTNDDIPSLEPCDDSSLDEWEPFVYELGQSLDPSRKESIGKASHIPSTFNQLIKLISILNNILHSRFSIPQLGTNLEYWVKNLPLHLKLPDQFKQVPAQNLLPPQYNLYLIYLITYNLLMLKEQSTGPSLRGTIRQQHPEMEIPAILLQFKHDFGIQALPATCYLLCSSLSFYLAINEGRSRTGSNKSGLSAILDDFSRHWTGAVPNQQKESSELNLTTPGSSEQAEVPTMTSLSSHQADPGETTPRMVQLQSQQADISGHGQPLPPAIDQTFGDLDLDASNITRSSALPAVDMMSTTPELLFDYFNLLGASERRNSRTFVQSLGFIGDFDYADL